jgi:hypothetical protein
MNDKQRRHFERGARVSAHCAANPEDFPADSVAGASLKRLNEHLAAIETLDVAKATNMSAQQQGSQGRRELRQAIRSQITTYYKTSEVIGRDHPEVKGIFQRVQTDKSDRTLLAFARSYSTAAKPLKSLFSEYGVSSDYFDSFDTNIDAFETHIARQNEGAGARVASNAGIEEALRHVDEEVGRLDVIARNKYRSDPAKLAAWESASHLERSARRKNGDGNGKKAGGDDKGGATPPPSHEPPQ